VAKKPVIKSKKTKRTALVRRMDSRHSWGLMILVVALVAIMGYLVVKDSHASNCSVSPDLVNSCRPWIGAAVAGNPQAASDVPSQVAYYEKSIGHSLDVVHLYNPIGDDTLSANAVNFANRANTYLYQNWKGPTAVWGDIDSQNAGIDQMAASIKALGSKKIFLTYWHEPENDVSPGGDPNCPDLAYKGSAGTVSQYKAAWAYIENRFASDGVTNVVWVMNYMGYSKWDCLIPDMWPGNSLVDWVTWDSYSSSDSSTWDNTVGRVYALLEKDNSATDNFESKPWGAGEWGDCSTPDQAHVYQYYDEAKAALDSNAYPRMKMYLQFASVNGPGAGLGCLTDYSVAGSFDPAEQQYFNKFADDAAFTSEVTAPTSDPSPTVVATATLRPSPTATPKSSPTPKPTLNPDPTVSTSPRPMPSGSPLTVSIASPSNKAKVSRVVTFKVDIGDPILITRVDLEWDASHMIRDATTQNAYGWGSRWDSTNAVNGNHTITVTVYDASGQSKSAGIDVDVDNSVNHPVEPAEVSTSLITDHEVGLKWKASTGKYEATGYRVYRDGILVGSPESTSYMDQGLEPSTQYAYAIRAIDNEGNLSPEAMIDISTLVAPFRPMTAPPLEIAPTGQSSVAITNGISPVVGGTLSLGIPSSATSTRETVSIDGGIASINGQIDTTYLANGEHGVTISTTEPSGQTQSVTRTIVVENKLNPLETTRDHLFAAFHGNKDAVNTGVGVVIGLILIVLVGFSTWLWRSTARVATSSPKSRTGSR
jgi:hypothetical protein